MVQTSAASRRALCLILAIAAAPPALAQQQGNAAAGREIAQQWCAGCHRIDAASRDAARTPPDFGAVARMPSLTEMGLRVFLQTPHGEMPRYQFSQGEMDDIIAYVMSLK